MSSDPRALTLASRCKLATDCLPPAEYRTRLERLHDDMLAEIRRLRHALAQSGKLAEDRVQQMRPDRARHGVTGVTMNSTERPAVTGPVEPTASPFAKLVERIGSPPDTHCWDEDTSTDCWSYSPAMVVALLDAQRERLAKACGAEHVGRHIHDDDLAYNNGARDCAGAVRRA